MKIEWSTMDTPVRPLTFLVGPDGVLAGGFTAGPGTTTTAPGRVDVVASGRDEQLWLRSWLGSGWTSWTPLGGRVVAGAELVSTGAGNLVALVRGADQRLYQRARVGGSWQAWTRLP